MRFAQWFNEAVNQYGDPIGNMPKPPSPPQIKPPSLNKYGDPVQSNMPKPPAPQSLGDQVIKTLNAAGYGGNMLGGEFTGELLNKLGLDLPALRTAGVIEKGQHHYKLNNALIQKFGKMA